MSFVVAAASSGTDTNKGFFDGVNSFFRSGTWLVIRNLAILLAVVFWLATIYWVYKDSRRRIDDPWFVAMATVIGVVPFIGPLIYMLFRPPEYLDDVRERELEIRAMQARLRDRQHCPVCRTEVDGAYLVCPVCTTRLKQACVSCKAPLEPLWQVCPYCESPIERRPVDLGATMPMQSPLDEGNGFADLETQVRAPRSTRRRRTPQ